MMDCCQSEAIEFQLLIFISLDTFTHPFSIIALNSRSVAEFALTTLYLKLLLKEIWWRKI